MGAIINNNIITIVFDDEHSVETPTLYRYDKGVIIQFLDVPDLVDVQFTNMFTNDTINKTITNGRVTIPDNILEDPSSIKAYLRYITAESEMTEKIIVIPVENREKPSDYISPEDEPTFREEMQQIMNDTRALAEETKEAVENLELTDEQIEGIAEKLNLSDYYTIDEIKTLLANKRTVWHGVESPSTSPTDFPGVIAGDIYYSSKDTNLYFTRGAEGRKITWVKVAEMSDIEDSLKNLNLTEEQISKIVGQIDLSNYVPTGRKVANIGLAKDISSQEIAKAISTTSEFIMGVGDAMLNQFNMSRFLESEKVGEKISTAITEALNNIPIAEGSEF